jgi:hypothetical protein
VKGITLCADCAYYDMKKHKCCQGAVGEPNLEKGDDVRFFTDCPLDDCEPVVRCKDCIYYHKPHVEKKDGTECDISEVPEEFKPIPNMCNSDFGFNVGGKCEYDNSYAPYDDDKTVFRQPEDYCSRGRRADNV